MEFPPKKKMAIDTSILLAITQYKKDIFEEAEKKIGKTIFYVPESVIKEMEELGKKSKTQQKRVNIAKKLIKQYNAKIVKTKNCEADKSLIELGKKGFIIASNDKEIRKQLKEFGVKIFYLKANKVSELE